MAKLTLREYSNLLQKFNPEKTAEKVIIKNGPLAVRLNQNQMNDGEDSKDSPITPSYFSASYATFKNRLNPRPGIGIPDLRLTGSFQAGMKFIKKGMKYFITSLNDKTGGLTEKYGIDIFGLNKANSKTFRNKNDKDFIQELKKHMGQ